MDMVKAGFDSPVQNRKGKHKLWIGIGLAAVVIVVFLVGFLTASSSSPEESRTHSPLEVGDAALTTKHLDLDVVLRTPTFHDAGSESCEYVPDEILSMARGIDITKLDLLSTTVGGVINNPGFKRPVIKLTCKHKRLKKDSNGNVLVQLPDQVKPTGYEHVSGKGLIHSTGTSRHTERNSFEVKGQMGTDVGLSSQLYGMFSLSVSYKEKRKAMVSNNAAFSETKTAYLVKKIDFSNRVSATVLEPHEDFATELEKLPNDFLLNTKDYLELINQYGTHYFASGKFGGFIQNSTEYAEGAADSGSSSQFNANAKTDLKFLSLKGSADYGKSQDEIQSRASGTTATKVILYGGDVNLGRSGNLEKWIESVEKSPTLFSGQLAPISSLVEDKLKKASLDIATKVYLGQAFVKDLDETLEILREERQGTNLAVINLMKKLLKNLTMIDLTNADKLADLDQQVTGISNSDPIPLVTSRQPGFATIIVFEAKIPTSSLKSRGDHPEGISVELSIVKMDNPGVELHRRVTGVSPHMTNPEWNTELGVPVGMDGAVKFCVKEHTYIKRFFQSNDHLVDIIRCSDLMTIEGIMEKKLNNVPIRVTGFASLHESVGIVLRVQISWNPVHQ